MKEWFMTISSTFIPIGFLFGILASERNDMGFMWLAVGAFIIGVITLFIAWRAVKDERNEDAQQFSSLLTEIKGLRSDIANALKELRTDRNASHNPDK